MNALHTLTVTKLADDESDDVEYTVTCPTPKPPTCDVWWECRPCLHKATEDEQDEGVYTAHGREHQDLDGMWMTRSESCALHVTDFGRESAGEAAVTLGIGVHQVDVDYWGDMIWDVIIPKAATS